MKLVEIADKPPTELFPTSPSGNAVLSGQWLIQDFYGTDGYHYRKMVGLGTNSGVTRWLMTKGWRLPTAPSAGDALPGMQSIAGKGIFDEMRR